MQETNKCKGLFGWLFGHKFEARYDENNDETEPGNFTVQQVPENVLYLAVEDGELLSDILKSMKANSSKSTYIHDICVRCGKVINKQDTPK
jgi:hypothetical protein